MIDLTKLTDAVTKVAGVAQAAANARAEADAIKAALANAQADIDALAAQLIAAVDTPAEAVGLAAVAGALVPVAFVAPVDVPTATDVPLTLDELNARIAAQNSGSAIS
jgi:hypothetical protein